MKPQDAVVLDNWFPRESDVVSRRGYTQFCATGESGSVTTTAEYFSGATRKLLCAVSGKILNITSGTASSLATGFTSSIWSTCMYNGRLFWANGADAPRDFDGTTLNTTGWTGPSDNTLLTAVTSFKNRLYFVEGGTRKAWYGGVGSITGALTSFDLGVVANFGGALVAIGVITHDGGDGVDDLLCFFFSSGEVAIYQGSYPGDTNFAIVGIFRLGPLVDKRAICKVGSDLVAATSDGYVPISQFLQFGQATKKRGAVSDKISMEASASVKAYGANSGWQVIVYPKGRWLLVNVPTAAAVIVQHVMNLDTGAWCRFTGMTALSWTTYSDDLYFGSTSGKVYKADTGFADNTAAITTDGQSAWNYFGDRAHLKRFTAARPIFVSDGDPGVQIGLGTDFDSSIMTASVAVPSTTLAGVWDVAVWDVDVWGGDYKTARGWQTVGGVGYCASLRVRTSNTAKDVRWQGTNIIFEPGALM